MDRDRGYYISPGNIEILFSSKPSLLFDVLLAVVSFFRICHIKMSHSLNLPLTFPRGTPQGTNPWFIAPHAFWKGKTELNRVNWRDLAFLSNKYNNVLELVAQVQGLQAELINPLVNQRETLKRNSMVESASFVYFLCSTEVTLAQGFLFSSHKALRPFFFYCFYWATHIFLFHSFPLLFYPFLYPLAPNLLRGACLFLLPM